MKKLIYGIFALAIIAAIATTASSAPDPHLETCLYNPEIQAFEKTIPGPGLEEFMYWDYDNNYLGKERWDPVTGECFTDTYDGCCSEPYDLGTKDLC